MKASTRRRALCLILGFGVSARFALRPAIGRANGVVSCPSSPMRLSRRVERSLWDGGVLSVDRSWAIEFALQGAGFAITGHQIEASVNAPDALSSLAAIEQNRSTNDMWPIMLSGDGRIVEMGNSTREEDIRAAIAQAEQVIANRPVPASEQEAQMQYLRELQEAGSSLFARLPDDLFFPRLGPVRSVRAVELPGGLTGEFEVSYNAVSAQEGEWLADAEREVVTRIEGSEQRAREVWTMRAL